MDFEFFNPFSSKFLKLSKNERKTEQEVAKNAAGYSEEDRSLSDQSYMYSNGEFNSNTANITFSQYFSDKKMRIAKYREMAGYPEISNAIDILVDECISKTAKGNSFSFEVLKTSDLKRSEIRELQDQLLAKYHNKEDQEMFSFGITIGELKQYIFPEYATEIKSLINSNK